MMFSIANKEVICVRNFEVQCCKRKTKKSSNNLEHLMTLPSRMAYPIFSNAYPTWVVMWDQFCLRFLDIGVTQMLYALVFKIFLSYTSRV